MMTGTRRFLRGYSLVVRWQLRSLKLALPIIFVVQVLFGIGNVIGMSFLFPDLDPTSARYISTGGSIMAVVMVGLIFVPQGIGEMKLKGTFDYFWSLPVPRYSYLAADLTIYPLLVLPATAGALAVASVVHGFDLSFSIMVVPAYLIITVTSVAFGGVIGHLSPSVQVTGLITNLLAFSLFLFAPVNFPADRLPTALQWVHRVLPIESMADLLRGTTVDGLVDNLARPFAVTGAWCVASLIILAWVFARRK